LYGDSAVGGVIQVLTNRPGDERSLTATGGSFGTFTADGSFGRRRQNLGFSASGSVRRTGGAFDHSEGHQFVGATSLEGQSGAFSWRGSVTGDGQERDDPGSVSQDAFRLDAGASDPIFRFDTVDRKGVSASFTLRHAAPTWRPQARVYLRTRNEDLVRTILLAPGLGDRRARDLSSVAVGTSLEAEHAFAAAGPIVTRFGLDLARESLDTSYRAVDDDGMVGELNSTASGRRVRAGVFASSSWELIPRVRVSGAIRWDGVDDEDFGGLAPDGAPRQRAWSPRAGVSIQLDQAGTASLFGQVSRAFKVPTLDQLFDPRPYPDFAGGTFTISNPRLVPQRATNIEGGISAGSRVRWSALAYRMAVDDEIDFDVRTFSYANIGKSNHSGFELEAEGRWWSAFTPSISYALSRVVESGGDRQLKNVPRHQWSVGGLVQLPWAVMANLRFRHASGAFLDDESQFAIDGPSTLDMRFRRAVGRHLLFVDFLNVTQDRYEEYGFTLSDFQGGSVPYIYAGTPRAVRAGVTVSF
jgi:outer membrane cobalamin receptor